MPLSLPKRFLQVYGRHVDLSPEQFDTLQRITGSASKLAVGDLLKSPEYRSISDAERSDAIKEALKEMRAAGRATVMGMFPELTGTALQALAPLPRPTAIGGKRTRQQQLAKSASQGPTVRHRAYYVITSRISRH